ncbi:hypothetical protein Tco_0748246 [Tanacetum coccineum]|uniref:Transposase (Putative), gypsy type n=1 Tax=Tanacetum coccineum TaxID=301880 RepID=A0ABQ4YV94_9ASTR
MESSRVRFSVPALESGLLLLSYRPSSLMIGRMSSYVPSLEVHDVHPGLRLPTPFLVGSTPDPNRLLFGIECLVLLYQSEFAEGPCTRQQTPFNLIVRADLTIDSGLESKVVLPLGFPIICEDTAFTDSVPVAATRRKDHASVHPKQSIRGGKSLAAIGLEADSTFASAAQETPADIFQAASSHRIRSPLSRLQQRHPVVTSGYVQSQRKPRPSHPLKLHGLRNQTKNLETLLEAEVDMKKAMEAKNAELVRELESLRAKFLDIQLSNNQLSQRVSTLQEQVMGEERIQATFEEFKKYEDDRVEKRCAEMDARLDALSIDFDEELYPHMLTMIVGRRWVIGYGLRLAVMKCAESIELRQTFANVVSARIAKGISEGLKYEVEHGEAKLDLAAIETYDPEAEVADSRRERVHILAGPGFGQIIFICQLAPFCP